MRAAFLVPGNLGVGHWILGVGYSAKGAADGSVGYEIERRTGKTLMCRQVTGLCVGSLSPLSYKKRWKPSFSDAGRGDRLLGYGRDNGFPVSGLRPVP